jgi:hypothetical protein
MLFLKAKLLSLHDLSGHAHYFFLNMQRLIIFTSGEVSVDTRVLEKGLVMFQILYQEMS